MRIDPALAHGLPALLLAFLVAVAYPLLGLRRYRKLENLPDPLPAGLRVKFYRNIIISQWTMVAIAVLVLEAGRDRLSDLGQSWGRDIYLTLGMSLLLVTCFAGLSTFTLRQLRRATADQLPSHARRAGRILPRTGQERAWFLGVALTAGVCEEILYRGYLPWVLWGLGLNVWLAFGLATLAFALGHAYQGRTGVIVTGVLGAFLSLAVALTHSLVPGQFLHVALDLVNGLALGAAMARIDAGLTAPVPAATPGQPPA